MSESNTTIAGQYSQITHIARRALNVQTHSERLRDFPDCGISVNTQFFNTTRKQITLVDRSGFKFYLSPQLHNNSKGCLRIVKIYTIRANLGDSSIWSGLQFITKLFNCEEFRDSSTTMGQLYQSYREQYFHLTNRNGYPPSEMKLFVEFEFTASQLENLENRLDTYHKDTDMLISFSNDPFMAGPHPYSESYKDKDALNMTYLEDTRKDRGIASLIEIVDNHKKCGNRFIWLAGRTLCIKPIQDLGREDGVYFKYSANATHQADSYVMTRYCKLEEMHTVFGLYPTQEEAATGGNPETITKANKMAMEKELEELKMLHSREAMELKREREIAEEKARIEKIESDARLKTLELEHNKRVTELKEENERRAAERKEYYEQRSNERRDTYEDRSYLRKDSTESAAFVREILKVGLVIAGTLIGWYAKTKMSN